MLFGKNTIQWPLALTLLISLILSGCAITATYQLNEQYGQARVIDRSEHAQAPSGSILYHQVSSILESRCSVCHGCYDAPCQFKTTSFDAVERGANLTKVYNGYRVLAEEPTRMFVDADSTSEWRTKGFFPVLNERAQNAENNLNLSLMYQLLELKQKHPISDSDNLSEDFDFSLDMDFGVCPTLENLEYFKKAKKLWGMPYALPGLSEEEHTILKKWIASGSKQSASSKPITSSRDSALIREWEEFFNGTSLKEKLMSRYIFEHLFVAHLYFEDERLRKNDTEVSFYELVRSHTPSGKEIEIISSRRPFEDPGTNDFYYRLRPVNSTILKKTHQPYSLSSMRKKRWRELFLNNSYNVKSLPSYELKVASNPFVAFQSIPVKSRYEFLLDEAEFSIMSFIRGPVCRGRIALNVIEDHFWVFFANPDDPLLEASSQLLTDSKGDLRMPSEADSNADPLTNWFLLSRGEKAYLEKKRDFLESYVAMKGPTKISAIWDGNGKNPNAALTIFRHYSTASVTKGLVGKSPKTSWVLTYPLLERIHYLLVAGFDVYGNVGHQILSRMYMDFLRMEGEFNFLSLLPNEFREEERDFWYRGAEDTAKEYIHWNDNSKITSAIVTEDSLLPKLKLYSTLKNHLAPALAPTLIHRDSSVINELNVLRGGGLEHMAEVSFVRVKSSRGFKVYSLIKNNGFKNIAELFRDQDRRVPAEDTLLAIPGLLGAHPNAFFDVEESQLPQFVNAIKYLSDKESYLRIKARYGVNRNSEQFWDFSDWLHSFAKSSQGLQYGLFDYNRLEG